MSNSVKKFPIATVVEISIIGVFPASEYLTLKSAVDELQVELSDRFEKLGGRDAHLRWVDVRPATREETIHFTPRKVHFIQNDRQICDTAYVAKRNLTADREKVTCKLCRRKLGIYEET
jgi:hypothetical protein